MQKKTILTILASAMLISTVQIAMGAEHHKARRPYRAPASESIRNSNDYYGSPFPWAQSDGSRYENGAVSAPAGR
jgi:hypothetical protein